MPRPKSVPDATVHHAIAALYRRGGDKAVTFAAVAIASGLAPPTLVQRYKSRDAMLEWALLQAWDEVDSGTEAALQLLTGKGAPAYLKALSHGARRTFSLAELVSETRSAALHARAEDWRARVEHALARAFAPARDATEQAAITFAAWQGQLLWEHVGGRGFRIKDVLRHLR